MLGLGINLKSWSGKTTYKKNCDDNGSALKTVAIDDYDGIWVLLTSVMEWHEPTQCTNTVSGEGEPFLVPVRCHNFEEANTDEVLWKYCRSTLEVLWKQSAPQNADCTRRNHYSLGTKWSTHH